MATDIEFSGGPSLPGATVVSSPYALTTNLAGGWVDFTGTNETLVIQPGALIGSPGAPSTELIDGEVYNFAPTDKVVLDNITNDLSVIGYGSIAVELPLIFDVAFGNTPILTLTPGTTDNGSYGGHPSYGTLTTNIAAFNATEPPTSNVARSTAAALEVIEEQTTGGIFSDSAPGSGPTLYVSLSDVSGTYYGTLYVSSEVNINAHPCFVTGTRILTDAGEVAVEELAVGDLVATASGTLRPVKWIGWRTLNLTKHNRPENVYPIRIAAGALADGIPCRDLVVSPDHALLFGNVLVQAKDLVDGVLVAPDTSRRHVTYWHVELDSHDVLIAEGAAAESFLDTGHRGFFENSNEPLTLHPNLMQEWRRAHSYRKLVTSGRPLTAIRKNLAARLQALGFGLTENRIFIRAGARMIAPARATKHGKLSFKLPPDTRDVTLVSGCFVPAQNNPKSNDRRELGVAIRALKLNGQVLPVEDVIDAADLHARAVGDATVWTRGDARLKLPAGGGVLELQYRGVAAAWRRGADMAVTA